MEQRYQLLTKIGSGGMAEVYHARQISPGGFAKEVAVKRLLPWLTSERKVLDMFFDEARILSGLNHPNIVQVHAFEQVANEYLLVMEYVHGVSLARLMARQRARERPLPASLAAHIGAETAHGLAYAHEKADEHGRPLRIVHRDVSPDNVLLSMDGMVKVVDFGIAKAADRTTETAHGKVKGKFCYMAPERLRSQRVDGRSDIFCLGLVLYEMLTGQRLFEGNNQHQVFFDIQTFSGLDPRTRPTDTPAALWEVTTRCLAPAPNRRYQEAAVVAADLEGIRRQVSAEPGDSELAEVMRAAFPEAVSAPDAAELASRMPDDPSAPISWPAGPPKPPGEVTQEASRPDFTPLPPTLSDVGAQVEQQTDGSDDEDDEDDEDEPTLIDPDRARQLREALAADDAAAGPAPRDPSDANPFGPDPDEPPTDDDDDLDEEPTDVQRLSKPVARQAEPPTKPGAKPRPVEEEPTGPTDVSARLRRRRREPKAKKGQAPWLQWLVVVLLVCLIAGAILLLVDPFGT